MLFKSIGMGKQKIIAVQSVTCLWNILLKPNNKEFSMEQIYTYYLYMYTYIQIYVYMCVYIRIYKLLNLYAVAHIYLIS